ncbi:MarR family transcriptional regulator [Gemmiger formicilis]|uniref:MarR family winged helix-turn-helix transcriptional regulator n=1 Tax=Gemmiger formicilis TaxID=745368 RepID=UPI00195D29F7|nr:MarR family transcriptional regulator [Gemmiger formicilis]MBM6717144.1 MarR family transcriptional regulator [Gemmiger formicilis]
MLDQAFQQVYTKFKLHFYKQVFNKFETREATLTTVESFCMEVIMALGSPTIAEFSNMMNLSTPNAAYKINNLVKKGYVKKVQSETDKREYHLYPTRKYIDYYSISYAYLQKVVDRAKQRFTVEELQNLERMLSIVSEELMPEIPLPKSGPAMPQE